MRVYICNYKGTIYGVFSTSEKADAFMTEKLGEGWIYLDGASVINAKVN